MNPFSTGRPLVYEAKLLTEPDGPDLQSPASEFASVAQGNVLRRCAAFLDRPRQAAVTCVPCIDRPLSSATLGGFPTDGSGGIR